VGLLAVSGLGGWLIGVSVAWGAWHRQPHRPASAPAAMAVVLAGGAWLGGLVGSWLVAMWLLPGSSRSFADRLAATPFADWLAPQLGAMELVQLALVAGAAAYGARSGAARRSDVGKC
jgi:hypothetical protein